MPLHQVHWVIDVTGADTPRQAAQKAWFELLKQSTPTEDDPCIFYVVERRAPGEPARSKAKGPRSSFVDLLDRSDEQIVDLAEGSRKPGSGTALDALDRAAAALRLADGAGDRAQVALLEALRASVIALLDAPEALEPEQDLAVLLSDPQAGDALKRLVPADRSTT